MRYCPDPDCPARRRSGHAAEYTAGISRCADCGAALVDESPTRAEARAPWPAPLRRRLWITAGLVLLAILAGLVPSPFLDMDAIAELGRSSGGGGTRTFGPFTLGILPVVSGFLLVEVLALVAPHWNSRRHGDPGFRHTLTVRSLTVGLLLAFLQGYFLATWLETASFHPESPETVFSIVPAPGFSFRLHFALTTTAGTALLALGALVISRHGVGNGFAWLVLLELAKPAEGSIFDHARMLVDFRRGGPIDALLGLLFLGLVLIGVVLALSQRPKRSATGLPLLLPTCGILPLAIAAGLLGLGPALQRSAGWLQALPVPSPIPLSSTLVPGTVALLLVGVSVLVVLVPAGSWLYWWRFRDRLAPPGHAMEWVKARLFSAFLLAVLMLISYGTLRDLRPGDSALDLASGAGRLLLWLLPAAALVIDLAWEIRARRRAPAGADLVPLAEYQHPAEALEDAGRRSAEAGAVVQGLRYRSLFYFFAPEIPCRVLGVGATPPQPAPTGAETSEWDTGFHVYLLDDPPRIRRRGDHPAWESAPRRRRSRRLPPP